MAGASRKRQTATGAGTRKQEPAKTTAKSGAARSAGNSRNTGSSRSTGNSKSTGKSSKGSGTTNTRGKSAGTGRYREPEIEDSGFMGTEVAMIVSFAISVLLFLSNFHLCGMVGDVCRGAMLGIFGSIGYIAPILLFAGTCFYMSNQGNIRAVMKMAAVAVVLLALCGLAQMIFGGGYIEGQKLLDYYTKSGASGDGGGLIGGLLVTALCTTLGGIGAYLVLIVMLAIGAVCITEKSLVDFVRRGSGRAYQYAKEDMDRRKVLHEERREEKRRLREEQRVRGVNLDATTLLERPLMRDFASGIPEGTVLNRGEPEAYEFDDEEFDNLPDPYEERAEQVWRTEPDPADVLRGRINLPGGQTEDVRAAASAEAAQLNRTVTEKPEPQDTELHNAELHNAQGYNTQLQDADPAIDRRENCASVKKESMRELHDDQRDSEDEDLLKSIYVRRDTRTLEEMALEEQEELAAARNRRTGGTFDRQAPAAEAAYDYDGQSPYFDEEEPYREPFDDDRSLEPDYRTAGTEIVEDDIAAYGTAYPSDDGFDREPDSIPEERETGLNYDSFYIPEEPKTVVTASGKVIETDAEMVRKTIERKREEKKAIPEDELSVKEQIERKAPAVKVIKKEYIFPSVELLTKGKVSSGGFSEKEYRETAVKLQQTLRNFGVGVTVTNISCGPSVTRYELHPEQGVKVSKIVSLADDIKLNLAAADIRIEAPIPGKAAVGIEVPNKENNTVYLRDLLESEAFKRHSSRLAFAVGKDIAGQTVVTDIAKMPHLLIAGATGSGKSVCINTLIMSVLYKAKPEDVKLIMIDPKVVELSVYNGIPHLLIPVVTDPKKASGALNWAVAEMTDRYNKFAQYNVRDLKGYNDKVEGIKDIEDENKPEKLPQIIIIVDELADLMMVAPGEVEDSICRLAQLARAAGIHLVIATQRPSVNVITGLIKANIPSRIAFSVSSGVDSRTIIDMNGAEKLLGKGDMLFYPSGFQKPQRVQGAFVSDQEVSKVVEFLTEQGMTSDYNPEIQTKINTASLGDGGSGGNDRDAYFVQAGRFIIEKDKASIGMLQRMFKIGFNRAARIMDQLADAGVVGEEEGTKPRKVLMSMEQFENMLEE